MQNNFCTNTINKKNETMPKKSCLFQCELILKIFFTADIIKKYSTDKESFLSFSLNQL